MLDPADRQQLNALILKVDTLDRKVAFLFKHLGVDYRDDRPPLDEVEQLIARGDRLAAIRVVQTKRAVGLAEAKRAVDEIAAKLGL